MVRREWGVGRTLFVVLFLIAIVAGLSFAQQNVVPDGFVRINGGTFKMGSPANKVGHDAEEEPQHKVTMSSFYMGKYEVTQKEYQEIMGTNPSFSKGDNLPVENVSWFGAIEYCNKRSQKEGLTLAYTIDKNQSDPNNTSSFDNLKWTVTWNKDANGYRLPTEAEWEYACRAGTTSAYNTGANISDNTGWYNANSGFKTHPVGQKSANAWGLYDMHGNMWEWCWDWYGDYTSDAQTDPVGPISGAGRVRRGGSWYEPAMDLRSAYRAYGYPSYRSVHIGFRLVRPL
jgi:formylglycine-generating enzyme required for sulfatase activity